MKISNKSILVVDDQLGIRKLLEEVLTEEGYDVSTAANGLEALIQVEEKIPNLILMDMKMPGLDGIDTLKELSAMHLADRVIMMTAYGELELVTQAKQMGACSHITKPFDLVLLGKMIQEYIKLA